MPKSVEKSIERLPQPLRGRVWRAIVRLKDEQRPRGARPLANQAERRYRIRVGDYSILYQIDDDDVLVVIVEVGHRNSVYRGLRETEPEYGETAAGS